LIVIVTLSVGGDPGHSRVLGVDEVGVLGVVLDEGAHDRAHDGDRLALRTNIVQHTSDQLGGDALFAELGEHRGGQQHESVVAGDVVGQPGHLSVPDEGVVDAEFLVLDDLEVERGSVGIVE
jgi:hypothetical protein